MIFHGNHMAKFASKTQNIVTLSSGESEFYACVSAASAALGCSSLFADLGVSFSQPILIKVDSSAAIGMGRRKGAGNVRHIATSTLWLQQEVAGSRIVVEKVAGLENVSDFLTKPVPGTQLDWTMKACLARRLKKSCVCLNA